jgi:hypothetical protein
MLIYGSRLAAEFDRPAMDRQRNLASWINILAAIDNITLIAYVGAALVLARGDGGRS